MKRRVKSTTLSRRSGTTAMFEDRRHAGRELGERLRQLGYEAPFVFGIPRGGVIVAAEVARILQTPLDVIVTAKIRAPQQPELGLGAVGPGGLVVRDEHLLGMLGIPEDYLEDEIAQRRDEVDRRMREYRGDREKPDPSGGEAVVVDDGVATGGTAVAAAKAVRAMAPSKLTLAVPVAAPQSLDRLKEEVDELVVLEAPDPFLAVGRFYRRFDQTTDDEVRGALSEASS